MLEFVQDVSWAEAFGVWRTNEQGIWDAEFTARGFSSWDAWRLAHVGPMTPESRIWRLYKVTDSAAAVPKMWVGPFRGWKKYFPDGAEEARFAELVASPTIRENPKVEAVLAHFPSPTTLMGVRHGDDIAIFEGSHRCMAITLAAKEGRGIAGELFIILTDIDDAAAWSTLHRQPKS